MATLINAAPTIVAGSNAAGWVTYHVDTGTSKFKNDSTVNWNPLIENITLVVDSSENGVDLSLEYSPEKDISAYEVICLTMLFMTLSQESMGAASNILKFVRKHNLERHFKIKQ